MQNLDEVLDTDLSDWEIARRLMSMLWNQYDVSGISYGRSLRAGLLEAIVFNTELPDGDGYDLIDLENKAKERKHMGMPDQLLLNLGMAWLPTHHFFCFIIREIDRWYEKYAHDELGPILTFERKTVQVLLSLMRAKEHLRQFDEAGISFSTKELLDEGKEIGYSLNLRDNCMFW